MSELEARSLSSRNTLGDTTHNTSTIGLSWVVGVYSGQAYAEVVVVVDEEATIPKKPRHLRRLKSLLKQPLMRWGTKLVRLRKAMVV